MTKPTFTATLRPGPTPQNPTHENRRKEQQAWLLAKMDGFRAAFVPRLNALPPRSAADASDVEEPSDE
jgi:hypothetical protein